MGMTITLPEQMTKLDITVYGNLTPVNDRISKSRVRIFYKGMNRNHTFITDDFANQLISSLPYTPIKGIFNYGEEDYEDHGADNSDGKIYGVVPEYPNFKWEEHIDQDGIKREYACCDVYLYTALYSEAKLIPGKGQSMEIYRDTLVGEWKLDEDGQPYYVFTSGSLLGLQVLGDNTEPCFEGSAFFSLYKEASDLYNYIRNFSKKEDDNRMELDKSLFRLSDSEKYECLFDALNPKFNEEGNWVLEYHIVDVYDEYAVCYNSVENKYVRQYYKKNENDVELGDQVDVFIVDVTETELKALEAMKSVNGTYEKANEKFSEMKNQIEGLEAEKADFTKTIEEKDIKINDLNSTIEAFDEKEANFTKIIKEKEEENADFSKKIEEMELEKTNFVKELNELNEFKKEVETEKKEEILSEFSIHLNDDQISTFKNNFDKYSVNEFKKEVCMTAYESDTAMFSHQNSEPDYIYKNNVGSKNESGMIKLLENYKNGGNRNGN